MGGVATVWSQPTTLHLHIAIHQAKMKLPVILLFTLLTLLTLLPHSTQAWKQRKNKACGALYEHANYKGGLRIILDGTGGWLGSDSYRVSSIRLDRGCAMDLYFSGGRYERIFGSSPGALRAFDNTLTHVACKCV